MKTRAIPAQITTVEDKIAGNLSLVQILLLMVPVFWATIVYALFTPRLGLLWYKFPLVISVLLICLFLSLRIRGKVILDWFTIILSYNIRPKYYVFNKNDKFLRTLDLPTFEKKQRNLFRKSTAVKQAKGSIRNFSIGNLVWLESLLTDPKNSFSLKTGRKGGLYVAFEQNQD